ncbi:MAG TPA: 2-oxo acid dehydrogenase subunit E2, partial [Chlamydiales bacterium]|nr:2-oxo acid dehydrogenase subunit E2 [Chlamydiales bacterium]
MSNDIFIPSMGESINEATIGKLLKQTGDIVEADEEVLEIETAKVNQLIYAPVRGVIAFTVKTGDVVKVGARVAIIQPVEAKSVIAPKTSPAKTAPPEPRASVAQIQKQEWMKETLKNPVAISSGTTPTGHREKMSSIRKAIAARLVQVSRETAMVTTFAEVDMSAIIEMREKYKDAFLKKFSTKLGFSSFFVTAAADALQAFEQVNSYIDGDDLVYRGSIDISVAVSSDKGLFVPVLKNADMMSYAEIEQKIDDF